MYIEVSNPDTLIHVHTGALEGISYCGGEIDLGGGGMLNRIGLVMMLFYDMSNYCISN